MCEARVLLFGGTTEGRLLCEEAARRGLPLDVCVAGDYGREVLTPRPGLRVLEGRLAEAQMEARIRAGTYSMLSAQASGSMPPIANPSRKRSASSAS